MIRAGQDINIHAQPNVVVFLNRDDEELLELLKLEVYDTVNNYKFPGDDVPLVSGSALLALEALVVTP